MGRALHGTVTDSDDRSFTDSTKTWTINEVLKWVRVHEQDREISGYKGSKLLVRPSWAKIPPIGSEYGIYPKSYIDGPGAYFKDLFVSEGVIPWTVDDIVDDILALCGVSRNAVFTNNSVGTLSTSSPVAQNISLTLSTTLPTSAANPATFIFGASTAATSGNALWSGLKLEIYPTTCKLTAIEGKGGWEPDIDSAGATSQCHHPAYHREEYRVYLAENFIFLGSNGHVLTVFLRKRAVDSGHSGSGKCNSTGV